MHVNVDQAGCHIQSRGVPTVFKRLRWRNVGLDRRDLAVGNSDVSNSADMILAVDDVAAFYQQIVILPQGNALCQ